MPDDERVKVPNRKWTSQDGGFIKDSGGAYFKRPVIVYMWRTEEDGVVETDRGIMEVQAGDYICYDEVTEIVWPISAEYHKLYYLEWDDA